MASDLEVAEFLRVFREHDGFMISDPGILRAALDAAAHARSASRKEEIGARRKGFSRMKGLPPEDQFCNSCQFWPMDYDEDLSICCNPKSNNYLAETNASNSCEHWRMHRSLIRTPQNEAEKET